MNSVFKEEMVFKIYELAKSGCGNEEIAEAIGVVRQTFNNWASKKKIVRQAVKRGRAIYKSGKKGGTGTFMEYVHGKLPAHLNRVWERLNQQDMALTGVEKMEALLSNEGRTARQSLFIHALISSNFRVSTALARSGVSYNMLEKWKEEDPDFPKLVEFLNTLRGNFFEDALCDAVAEGDTAATIFANRTFNRERGYNDKLIDIKKTSHQINEHVVKVADLDLSISEKRALLAEVRKTKQIEGKPNDLLPQTIPTQVKEIA
ncbi:MAG: hypothetical protein ACYSW8_32195 [Planctomycetota bacterium]|jgi:hypothetical protein